MRPGQQKYPAPSGVTKDLSLLRLISAVVSVTRLSIASPTTTWVGVGMNRIDLPFSRRKRGSKFINNPVGTLNRTPSMKARPSVVGVPSESVSSGTNGGS
jgi:hypothetical protein